MRKARRDFFLPILLLAVLGSSLAVFAQEEDERRAEIVRLNELTDERIKAYEYSEARPDAERAVDLARELGDKELLAATLYNLGNLTRRMEDYAVALPAAAESAEIFTEIEDFSGAGESWNVVGGAHWKMTDYSKALEFWGFAREAFEKAQDLSGLSRILNNVGITYRGLEQYDRALELYEQALEIQENLGDEKMTAMLLNNIGSLNIHQEDPKTALEYFQRSLEIKERLGDKPGMSNTISNLGQARYLLGDLDEALKYYRRSLGFKDDLGLKKGSASTRRHIAKIHFDRGEYDLALEELRLSIDLGREVNAREELREAYRDLSATLEKTGRYREALQAFKDYQEVASEIFDENNSTTIAEMQTRFEVDLKNQEIENLRRNQELDEELHRRQTAIRRFLFGTVALLCAVLALGASRYRLRVRANRFIEEKNRALTKATDQLVESEKRAAMGQLVAGLVHEINNPINFVSAGLPPLRRDIERLTELTAPEHESVAQKRRGQIEQLLDAIEEGARRAGAIVQDLRTFSRVDHAAIGKVDLHETLDSVLALHVQAIGDRIDVVREYDSELSAVTVNPGGIHQVFLHLISNAVQAIEKGGTITLQTSKDEAEIRVGVRDSGQGIPSDILDKIFDPFFTTREIGHGRGLGLSTSRAIVEQHGGRVEIVESSPQGTEIAVFLPVG